MPLVYFESVILFVCNEVLKVVLEYLEDGI